jgi:hypothetical protein
MTRIAEDHDIWPSASTRMACDPARRSRTTSGVTPAACRSMNTRAPCGNESIRNEPTNDSFCLAVAAGVFSTSGRTVGSFATTRMARSATDDVSGAGGETGTGAGGIDTGSGRGVNGSARGCSDEVSQEIRITHNSAPKAEPDANDHRPRRFFATAAVSTIGGFARPGSARRPTGRRVTRLLGVGRGVAGLIDAGRSLENSSSGSGAHRPLRSWLTAGFVGSSGWSGTVLGKLSAIPVPGVSPPQIEGFPETTTGTAGRSHHG